MAIPNLQAIVVATDGRFHGRRVPADAWPAPVFPLHIVPASREVQGESVLVHQRPGETASDLEVRWRLAGQAEREVGGGTVAVLEIRDSAGSLVAREPLSVPAATSPGTLVVSHFRRPWGLDAPEKGGWIALLRPASPDANVLEANDTVVIVGQSGGRPRHLIAGPVVTLRERGLIDALTANDSMETEVIREGSASSVRTAAAVWVRAMSPHAASASAIAASLGVPLIRYMPGFAEGSLFGAGAGVSWRMEGTEYMPAAVLRAGDLAIDTIRLPSPTAGIEPLAWAEQDGRMGLLFWRDTTSGTFGAFVPSLWEAAFRPDGGAGVAGARAWIRGIARWTAAAGTATVMVPDTAFADRPFSVAASIPRASDDSVGLHLEDVARGFRYLAHKAGPRQVRIDSLSFPAGRHAVRLIRDGEEVWSGSLHVRDPEIVALSLLGADAEALQALASNTGGKVLRLDPAAGHVAWPELAGGHAREERESVIFLAPIIPFILFITIMLSLSWWYRKRHRLD